MFHRTPFHIFHNYKFVLPIFQITDWFSTFSYCLPDTEKASVHCASKEITVFIGKAYLPEFKLSDLRLSDASCPDGDHGAENATHFIIRVPLVGCGTESSENSKSILYSNRVRQRPVVNEVINRLSILSMPFTCAYPKEASASLQQMEISSKVT